MIDLRETTDGVTIAIKAQPGAKRNEIVGVHGTSLKVQVSAVREKGKANEALLTVLAEALQVPIRQVCLLQGATSKAKVVAVTGLSVDSVRQRLTPWLDLPDQ